MPTLGETGLEPLVPATRGGSAEPGSAPDIEQHRRLVDAAERLLDGVDRALAALDAGTYGTCDVCGAAVDDRDLEEDPLLTRCGAHRAPRS